MNAQRSKGQSGIVRKADKFYATASYAEAAELYSQAISQGQENVTVLTKAADCYFFMSKYEQAEPLYKDLIEKYKDEIENIYYFRYSQTLKALGKDEEANKWYRLYDKDISTNEFKSDLEKLATIKSFGDKFEIQNMSFNSNLSDFGPYFHEKQLIYASPSKKSKNYNWTKQPYLDLYAVKLDDSNRPDSIAKPFSDELNSDLHESNVAISKDGKFIYFTRNNSSNGGRRKSDDNKVTHMGIYRAEMVNGKWTNIQPLSFNSSEYGVMHPALNKENDRLYFASDMPGSVGSFDIYYADVDAAGNVGAPTNLGPVVNTKNREVFPFMSNNNKLYFASDGHIGFGLLDVFMSELKKNSFTKPFNVGLPVNTNSDDFGFVIDENKKIGFFSSNRPGGKGDDDIYGFLQTAPLKEFEYWVQGAIVDTENDGPVNQAVVQVLDEKGNVVSESKVGQDGKFILEVDKPGNYKVVVKHPNFLDIEKSITIKDNGKPKNELNFKMDVIPESCLGDLISDKGDPKVVINNGVLMFEFEDILFDFDSAAIKEESKVHLNKLVAKLKQFPHVNVEIGSHTDSRGSDEYNLRLSEQRAASTKAYLVSRGINERRLLSVGYGETRPRYDCSDHQCTDAEYQINRRVEFVVLVKPTK